MTTLVTGATGFLGNAVARLLRERGEEVRVLARRDSDRSNLRDVDVDVAEGDLRDEASLRRALADCEHLFHVAADYRLWARRPQDLYDSNVTGTVNIMRAALAAGVSRVVYTSSVATLGLVSGGSADEDTPARLADMVGHYKRSKFLAEQAVTRLIEEAGLPAVIVNPSTPVGPGDIKPTPTGRMIRDAATGRMPGYVQTGLNVVHVEDVAHGHLLAMAKGAIGRRYILGGDNLSLRDILACVSETGGYPAPRVRIPRELVYPIAWLAEARAWLLRGAEPRATIDGLRMSRKMMYFSSERAARELGYTARPARAALHDAARWFIERQRS